MKTLKTLSIAVALLGSSCFGAAAIIHYNQKPIQVIAEGETTSSEIPTGDETTSTNEEDVKTLTDKIEELEALVKAQTNEILNKELISGLTIGGAIVFAMEALLAILRWKYGKRKENSYNERFSVLQEKFNTLMEKCLELKNESEKFLQKGCEEMNTLTASCSELLKEIRDIIPQLKEYEKFNQRVVAVINILDKISFTPENVKNGIAEEVKKLVEEVK